MSGPRYDFVGDDCPVEFRCFWCAWFVPARYDRGKREVVEQLAGGDELWCEHCGKTTKVVFSDGTV